MAIWDDTFTDDEKVAERAVADYPLIAPVSGNVASGTDGVLSSSSRWELTSASTDFGVQDVERAHVAVLTRVLQTDRPQDILAVESASGNTVTLRRVGKDAGKGQPPGPVTGSYTGVDFKILSCEAQIRNWTRIIRERLRILTLTLDEIDAAGRLETFEDACTSFVLYELYVAKAREGSASQGGASRVSGSEYWAKGMEANKRAETLMTILGETYGSSPRGRRSRTGALASPDPYPPDPAGVPRVGVASDWGDTSVWPGWSGR